MAAKRRILLAEVAVREADSYEYAVWNDADKTAGVTVTDVAELTAQVTGSGRPPLPHKGIRATLPLTDGKYYWEVTFSGGVVQSEPNYTAIGVYHYTGTPGQYLDQNLTSPGGVDGVAVHKDGTVWHAGLGSLASTGAISDGAIVRVLVDMDARTISFAVNGGSWVTLTDMDLTVGFFDTEMRPAVTSRDSNTFIANFGEDLAGNPFAYAVPAGARAGVYRSVPGGTTTLHFSSEAFGTGPGEVPASTQYMPRISRQDDVEIVREGSCWVWGGQSSSRRGSMTLVNTDGGLDQYLDYGWRDAPTTLWEGYEGDARSAFTLWARTTVDSIDVADKNRIRIALADPLSQFDRALQTELYPDDQPNPNIAGKPKPIVIGLPMYCEAVRLDANPTQRGYDVHDGKFGTTNVPLVSIAAIYDRGDVFSYPVDWSYRLDPDGNRVGFTLANAPHGKIVCNPVGPMDGVMGIIQEADRVLAHVATRAWVAAGNTGAPPWGDSIGAGRLPLDEIAFFSDQPITALSVMRQVMDSHLGWVWARRDGSIDAAMLQDPDAGMSPSVHLDTTNVVSITLRDDDARGLTLRIAGRRNHSPHSDGDIAGSVPVDPVSAPFDLRQELKSEMTITRTYSGIGTNPIAQEYAFAETAPAQNTLLQYGYSIQELADRVAGLWAVRRRFFEVDALMGPADSDQLEPGQVAHLTWARYGLQGGRNLAVIRVASRFFSRRVALTLWG